MIKALLIIIWLFSFSCFSADYTFAFVPQQSANKLAKNWQPILDYLNDKTGDHYTFKTAKDIPTFEARVLQQEYDVAYMNPYHFVVFNERAGYQAIAKQRDKMIKGIIVVKKGAGITDLSQLQGETLAFPAPAAFAASILPRGELMKQGIEFTPKYVSSHDSVYLNVSRGFAKAGGGVMRTFNNADPKIKSQLDILWTTRGYTPHAFAVKKVMPEDARQRLVDALLSLELTGEGIRLLEAVNFKGIMAASNEDWQDIKALELEALVGK
ncbi:MULTISPECIES: PhnD/SsuA/transferrin family substrate-binding protein [Pseudoalteromonas]|uniref:PhnD/SsuA/transferrin family substrate-binding protein n=1 Tax=Pseudoalteromonas TaxID=53246 RepID=UPI000FFF1378|nr:MULTISPECIES: PhnD/SsuA/transferrin family substrate-binding protein [Pseudoalteromonas]MCG9759098.1 phosphate/phosphite/phosphonate ABC transporter substrate-binding protein [Pseudoalteromonas sp. Isolate6]NKC18989.1 PhnD/SsuA/transferrin family substrate-binding protein [Pseudoalteromonas galatheae]RXE87387.1 phosphate ABC transporter substrate-binding protein [Pseudoalteromonas sp. A757]